MNDSQLPDVGGIVVDRLIDNGYDGLEDAFDFSGCSCMLEDEDLMTCEKFNFSRCKSFRRKEIERGDKSKEGA